MKVYLVGGPVRDELLGRQPNDLDYVVVGSSPEEMLQKGYVSVGKSFPVFLHPETHHEYALARIEKKVAKGHQGFEFIFPPHITLEEDLWRRDFTVNAMAKDLESGEIIDPYGGREDLENKILRHVSQHFVEDPLRIFRGIRLAADLGFSIHPSTLKLMQSMLKDKEWYDLSWERILNELYRGLCLKNFLDYFKLNVSLKIWEVRSFKWHQLMKKEISLIGERWKKFLKTVEKRFKDDTHLKRNLTWSFFLILTYDKENSRLPFPRFSLELSDRFHQFNTQTFNTQKKYLDFLNRLRWGQREELLADMNFFIKLISGTKKIEVWKKSLKMMKFYKKKSLELKKKGTFLNEESSNKLKVESIGFFIS
ncbi:MAG: hypothetical protein QE271_12360 [Bacteriovoracaceae bacterium]|nr:hypothetical protein [Bacteriovoracaceae bacterium]